MLNQNEIIARILQENRAVLEQVRPEETGQLIDELGMAAKVYIFAIGRVFLSLQCLGKRLGHLDIDCQVVGSITEKPITPRDLLLVASGSGESKLPVEIARIAKGRGARLGLITSAQQSTLKTMSNFTVHLPCPTKNNAAAGIVSIQSMSTLFDQALHLYGDAVCLLIQQQKGITNEQLWTNHANLE